MWVVVAVLRWYALNETGGDHVLVITLLLLSRLLWFSLLSKTRVSKRRRFHPPRRTGFEAVAVVPAKSSSSEQHDEDTEFRRQRTGTTGKTEDHH